MTDDGDVSQTDPLAHQEGLGGQVQVQHLQGKADVILRLVCCLRGSEGFGVFDGISKWFLCKICI